MHMPKRQRAALAVLIMFGIALGISACALGFWIVMSFLAGVV